MGRVAWCFLLFLLKVLFTLCVCELKSLKFLGTEHYSQKKQCELLLTILAVVMMVQWKSIFGDAGTVIFKSHKT